MRMRFVFTAHPKDSRAPKQFVDEHSRCADWFTWSELEDLPLRSDYIIELLEEVRNGAPLHPVSSIIYRHFKR